jgi:tetratricopeptide (TPR) repeat protein
MQDLTQSDTAATVPGDLRPQTLVQGFEHLPSRHEFSVGARLGPYVLRKQLGAGGMGVVWLAEQLEPVQRPVALKLVQRRLMGGLAEAYFQVERQSLAQMNHPAIARIFDAGALSDGELFFAMEYIEGRTLDSAFAQRAGAVHPLVRTLLRVCHGVQHAHQKGVIHRDLKPANILVAEIDGDLQPKIIDFGVAIGMTPGVNAARSEGAVGTRDYMAPEQASPDGLLIDARADVYALGAVLAELLCLVSGVQAPGLRGGLSSHGLRSAFAASLTAPGGVDPALSIRALRQIPAELRAIAIKAMAEQREERYDSAAAMAEDLGRWLRLEPVLALPDVGWYRARCFIRRHRLALAATAAIVLALGSGLAAALYGLSEAERGRALAQTERDGARAAAVTARAVKDYMVSVFQGADPELAGRRDLPVSHFLDAGSERLRGTLGDQPATRAELAIILGGAYQSIGQRPKAITLFDEAIALARAEQLPELLADALHRKAYSLYDMSDYAAAQPVVREAHAIREAQAPGSRLHLASLRLLGSILSYLGQFEEADVHLARALALAEALPEGGTLERGLAHLDLARHSAATRNRSAQVLQHASAATEALTAALGADHIRVADALEVTVVGLVQSGRAAESIPLAAQLVERRTALYGETSHPRSYALHAQASVLRWVGQHRAAMPIFEASLAIHDELDGPDSVASLEPLFGLALTLEQAGDHARALTLFQRCAAIQQAHPDNVTRPTAELRLHIVRNLHRSGQSVEAERKLAELQAAVDADPTARAGLRADLLLQRATIARERGQLDLAVQVLESIAVAERTADWHAERAQSALARADLQLAKAEIDRALERSREGSGPDSTATWLLRIHEAQWMRAAGRRAAARTLAGQIEERLQPMIHPDGRWARELRMLGAPVRSG